MDTVILVFHIVTAFTMIVIILLQRSEGGALGMGGGGGGGVVSGRGAANLLTRTTAVLGATFFATSLLLGILGHKAAPVSAVGAGTSTAAPAGRGNGGESVPARLPDLKITKPGAGSQQQDAPDPLSPPQATVPGLEVPAPNPPAPPQAPEAQAQPSAPAGPVTPQVPQSQ